MEVKINLNQVEKILPIIIVILSLNRITAIISCIGLLLYGIKSPEKAVKGIIYNFLLSQLNPTMFSNPGNIRIIINIILMLSIFRYKGAYLILKRSLAGMILIIFSLYIVIVGVAISWLPLVSIFKGIYFTVGFLSIYIGVRIYKEVNWIDWIEDYFKMMIGLNFIFIFLPNGYSTNGRALNGIFANPNALGIVTVLAVAIFLYGELNKGKISRKIFILIAIVEIFISDSRTSMLTLGCIVIYSMILKVIDSLNSKTMKEFDKKVLILIGIAFLSVGIYKVYGNEIKVFLEQKILKGQDSTQVLASRDGQVDAFEEDFNENQLLGVGFGVDGATNRARDWSFKLSYPVERGNIVLAVLAETGIIGFVIFICFILSLVIESIKNNGLRQSSFKAIFVIGALMISMGEMTFFSGNSLGVVQWFMLTVYSTSIEKESRDESIILN